MPQQSTLRNRILAQLAPGDFALLDARLQHVTCGRSEMLAAADQPVAFVHFPETGIAPVIARSPEGHRVEAGIIGREGFVHHALVLGTDRSPFDINMQLPDDAHRIARAGLLRAVERSTSLRDTLLRFADDLASASHPLGGAGLSAGTCRNALRRPSRIARRRGRPQPFSGSWPQFISECRHRVSVMSPFGFCAMCRWT